MSANQPQSPDDTVSAPMTQMDYVDRMLEPRDTGLQSAAALLSGLACGFGVLALWFAPMVLGFVAIGLAIIGLAIAGERNRFGKIALTIAAVGWLIGSMIAVFTGNSPISISLA
ncbi:MAG: hypothetical protein EXQ67_02740 [Thermoleophilia bacterium]|nr:hypothetical protein [Thermoleophilia bacterium]